MMKNILLLCILTGILSADFIRNSDSTVTDTKTRLMWQDNTDAKTVTKTWQGAIDYCENLTLGGHSDWRLPNYNELESIVDYGRYGPAIDPTFQNVVSYYYWSSTTNASHTDSAWYVYFYNGDDTWHGKSGTYYVRCVRSADN